MYIVNQNENNLKKIEPITFSEVEGTPFVHISLDTFNFN